ncbi:hypothetical protein D9M70_643350 [compost metagenome]
MYVYGAGKGIKETAAAISAENATPTYIAPIPSAVLGKYTQKILIMRSLRLSIGPLIATFAERNSRAILQII